LTISDYFLKTVEDRHNFFSSAAAWSLEEDDESGVASGSTDGGPFGYTTGGLYHSTDARLQSLHTLEVKINL